MMSETDQAPAYEIDSLSVHRGTVGHWGDIRICLRDPRRLTRIYVNGDNAERMSGAEVLKELLSRAHEWAEKRQREKKGFIYFGA